jgi:hypothetical protein
VEKAYKQQIKEGGTYRHEIILMPSGGGIKTTNQRGRYILTFSIL